MTRPVRTTAALVAAVAIALLTGCTAQSTAAPASGTTATPVSVQEFACPTRAEVAGLTAIPFSASASDGDSCTYTTAADAGTVATVTLRHPAGAADATLSALRYAAIGRGAATADARAIAFDAFTSTTKQDCTVWFPAADGVASSVTARRAGASGARACDVATAVATLAGSATSKAAAPTVAVIAPRTLLGTTTATQRWPWRIAQRTTARIDRLTGTGYLDASSAGSFATLASDVPADSAAVVFVSGTAEAGTSSLTLLRDATRALSDAATRAPKARLIVVGPVSDGTAASADVERLGVDLQAVAKIAGARYVDPADPVTLNGVADQVATALGAAGVTEGSPADPGSGRFARYVAGRRPAAYPVWFDDRMPNTLCVCGHQHDAHEHYRRGTDCATCGAEVCPRFRAARVPRRQPPAEPTSPATEPAERDRQSH